MNPSGHAHEGFHLLTIVGAAHILQLMCHQCFLDFVGLFFEFSELYLRLWRQFLDVFALLKFPDDVVGRISLELALGASPYVEQFFLPRHYLVLDLTHMAR